MNIDPALILALGLLAWAGYITTLIRERMSSARGTVAESEGDQ